MLIQVVGGSGNQFLTVVVTGMQDISEAQTYA